MASRMGGQPNKPVHGGGGGERAGGGGPGGELDAYFAGERREFDLELDLVGTNFQRRVWEALLTIPYGETRSYTYIAEQIGSPGAVRAVGLANGRNPIGIIVPCHRVIGANGSLTGYGGGLERKQALLELGSFISAQPPRTLPGSTTRLGSDSNTNAKRRRSTGSGSIDRDDCGVNLRQG